MPALRLLVVDDHPIVRRSICSLLAHDLTLGVICETTSGEDAITKADELQPDVVLLDISLPRISGIEAARQIRNVSSQHDSLLMANEALRAGGHGYVTKVDAGSELLKAIRTVREGTCFVSKRIVDQGWTAPAA